MQEDQTGLRYGVKHLAWFAAIESGDTWGQDRNRFIRMELLPPTERGSLTLPEAQELGDLGHRLAAAALWAAPAAVAMADSIKNERPAGVFSHQARQQPQFLQLIHVPSVHFLPQLGRYESQRI